MEELLILTLSHFPSVSLSDLCLHACVAGMSMLYSSLCTGPAIDVQPSDVNAEVGGTATFTVEASGEGLSYEWFGPDGEPLSDQAGEIEGSNTPTLQILNVQLSNAGGYSCVVSNSDGSVISDRAFLTFSKFLN